MSALRVIQVTVSAAVAFFAERVTRQRTPASQSSALRSRRSMFGETAERTSESVQNFD
jgi:hypothetical protein